MNGPEFIKRAKRYAKRTRQDCRFEKGPGKGSHGRLWIGDRFTTVKRSDIGPGLLAAMLSQLHIDKKDF